MFNFDSNKKGPSWIKISCFREGQILFCKKKNNNTPILHDWNSLKLISLSDNLFVMLWRCFVTNSRHLYRRLHKKSPKMPTRLSEYTKRRRTDNTMVKRKSTKGQTTSYKTIHTKLTNNHLQNTTHKTDKQQSTKLTNNNLQNTTHKTDK